MIVHFLKYKFRKYSLPLLALSLLPVMGYAQLITRDYKLHDVGNVRQIITNHGNLNKENTNYPGLINCEFPPHSYVEHLGSTGWYIGGITPSGDTLVSVTHSFNSPDEFPGYSSAPWDTVWEADRGDTLNIPYINKPYTPVSDQDFVTRYNDYNEAALKVANHNPLYLDVIQKSYAWASPPLNNIIVINYAVVAEKFNIKNVYLSLFCDPNVGYRTGSGFTFANDDYVKYYPKEDMVTAFDAPGGPDGGTYSPIGLKIVPPKSAPPDSIKWTWIWQDRSQPIPPTRDPARFVQMKSGTVMENQITPNQTHFILSFGPFNMVKGDTLHFKIALVLGKDENEVNKESKLVDMLVKKNFKVPSPPPAPTIKVKTANRQVTINWSPDNSKVNPETYTDPNRGDSVKYPFEGYRIYKSTQSATGPWTLLAQYDKKDDNYGLNTGLKHEYT
ncbi:MAG TPA: hypothetical protein VKA34_09135, partial [Balneolales bacterium]|nr:hypothetical protein [Balneolales bacterium]